jgi:hypothetical protein
MSTHFIFLQIYSITLFSQMLFVFLKNSRKGEEYLLGTIHVFENYGNTTQAL